MVEEGKPAPDFELASDSGRDGPPLRRSAASRSSSTSIPRTTRPAARGRRATIRDAWGEFERARRGRARRQPRLGEASHAKFRAKYGLPFTLLADADHAVAETYGVWGEKSMCRQEVHGHRALDVRDRRGRQRRAGDAASVEARRATRTTCSPPSLPDPRYFVFGALAKYLWPGCTMIVFLSTRSSTCTIPETTRICVPLQKSSVSQFVPRTVPDA